LIDSLAMACTAHTHTQSSSHTANPHSNTEIGLQDGELHVLKMS